MSNVDAITFVDQEPKTSSRTLRLYGHDFTFEGEPGQATSIQSKWGHPFEDDAVRLAHLVVEASLLALYSSGALQSEDGSFVPEVVEAFKTTLDQVPNLLERLDDEPALSVESPVER